VTREWLKNGALQRTDARTALRHDHAGMPAEMAAFRGFDLVSYTRAEGPIRGAADFALILKGRTYLFATPANRAAFLAEPGRFLPQYDGHCAFAMASNKLAPGNPEMFRWIEGKLYFNLNAQIHAQWERNAKAHIEKADAYWLRRLSI
jgi:YHS domain-containing protein